MIAEYLEHALQFERMAASEKNPELRAQLEKQAAAYRKLAGERANKLGLQSPPGPKKKILKFILVRWEGTTLRSG
jgi:hypothetical protein